jgi:hypothetical protein
VEFNFIFTLPLALASFPVLPLAEPSPALLVPEKTNNEEDGELWGCVMGLCLQPLTPFVPNNTIGAM